MKGLGRLGRLSGSFSLVVLFSSPALACGSSPALVCGAESEAHARIPPAAAYLGEDPPGETPKRFAPALLSPFPFLGRLAFSPDGKECFFTVDDALWSTMRLFVTRYEHGAWTPPEPAPFDAEFARTGEPFFSADGKLLFFTALAKDASGGMDIWMVRRRGHGWGTLARLPAPINSDANEYCFSKVRDGTMYFLSGRPGSPQLYRARAGHRRSLQVEMMPEPVTMIGAYDGDPGVPADSRFVVFYSGRPGGYGYADLYVSFQDGEGEWAQPVNLGPDYNTDLDEYGATVSADGKYLFFTRHGWDGGELYWVSIDAIDKLRRE